MSTPERNLLTEHSILTPSIGFPVSIFALFFGDHPDLCLRFLDALYRHTPAELFHLTAGLNSVSPRTRTIIGDFKSRQSNINIIESDENIFKCPMMRRMFESADDRPWKIWFDDDSYVTKSDWLQTLSLTIEASRDAAMFGKIYCINIPEEDTELYRKMNWYTGIPFEQCRENRKLLSLRFATGGFWAIRSSVVKDLDWPNPEIVHFNDDYTLGEALRQQRQRIESFEYGVTISQAPRRK